MCLNPKREAISEVTENNETEKQQKHIHPSWLVSIRYNCRCR